MASFIEAYDSFQALKEKLIKDFGAASDALDALFIVPVEDPENPDECTRKYMFEVALMRDLTEQERKAFPAEFAGIPVRSYVA